MSWWMSAGELKKQRVTRSLSQNRAWHHQPLLFFYFFLAVQFHSRSLLQLEMYFDFYVIQHFLTQLAGTRCWRFKCTRPKANPIMSVQSTESSLSFLKFVSSSQFTSVVFLSCGTSCNIYPFTYCMFRVNPAVVVFRKWSKHHITGETSTTSHPDEAVIRACNWTPVRFCTHNNLIVKAELKGTTVSSCSNSLFICTVSSDGGWLGRFAK